MTQATNTTTARNTSKGNKAAAKQAAALVAPPVVASPFKTSLQNIANAGKATATAASKAVEKAATAPKVGNVAPVGVAVRNAGQATTIPGLSLVGTNGRKQPLASSVTAQIWLAALAHQLANNGAMPTQAHIKLACPTVNPTSCGLGLTQYKAYTGQCKGMPVLTLAQLQAMATAPAAPAK
jgi:beta-lactamase class A